MDTKALYNSLLLLLTLAVTTRSQQASTMSYVINSGWNETGHRVFVVELDHETPVTGNSTKIWQPLTVNLEHSVVINNGVEIEHLLASTGIFSPRVTETPPDSTRLAAPGSSLIPGRRLDANGRPVDYELFRGVGYYKVFTESQTWEQARRICESENAHLMVIDSQREVNVVQQLMRRKPQVTGVTFSGYWNIGFGDHDTEGVYVTVTGKLQCETGYNEWIPGAHRNEGHPPYTTDSDCGCMNASAQLDDCPCYGSLPFICEQEL